MTATLNMRTCCTANSTSLTPPPRGRYVFASAVKCVLLPTNASHFRSFQRPAATKKSSKLEAGCQERFCVQQHSVVVDAFVVQDQAGLVLGPPDAASAAKRPRMAEPAADAAQKLTPSPPPVGPAVANGIPAPVAFPSDTSRQQAEPLSSGPSLPQGFVPLQPASNSIDSADGHGTGRRQQSVPRSAFGGPAAAQQHQRSGGGGGGSYSTANGLTPAFPRTSSIGNAAVDAAAAPGLDTRPSAAFERRLQAAAATAQAPSPEPAAGRLPRSGGRETRDYDGAVASQIESLRARLLADTTLAQHQRPGAAPQRPSAPSSWVPQPAADQHQPSRMGRADAWRAAGSAGSSGAAPAPGLLQQLQQPPPEQPQQGAMRFPSGQPPAAGPPAAAPPPKQQPQQQRVPAAQQQQQQYPQHGGGGGASQAGGAAFDGFSGGSFTLHAEDSHKVLTEGEIADFLFMSCPAAILGSQTPAGSPALFRMQPLDTCWCLTSHGGSAPAPGSCSLTRFGETPLNPMTLAKSSTSWRRLMSSKLLLQVMRSRESPNGAFEIFAKVPGIMPTDLRVRVFPPDRLLIEVRLHTSLKRCLSKESLRRRQSLSRVWSH